MNIANIDNVHIPDARGLRQIMQINTSYNNNTPQHSGAAAIQCNDNCYNNKSFDSTRAERIASVKTSSQYNYNGASHTIVQAKIISNRPTCSCLRARWEPAPWHHNDTQ